MSDRYAHLPADQLRALLASERIGETAKDSIRAALLARQATNGGKDGVSVPPTPGSCVRRDSRALRPTRLEADEQQAGIEYLRAAGWRVWRIGQRDARGTQDPGVPDVKAYHPVHGGLWWEAKGKDGRQRPDQREFQAAAEAAGEWYVLGGEQQLRAALTERLGDGHLNAQQPTGSPAIPAPELAVLLAPESGHMASETGRLSARPRGRRGPKRRG